MKRKDEFVIKLDSRKLLKIAAVWAFIAVLIALALPFIQPFIGSCYKNTYVLADQRLDDAGGRCKNCLVIEASAIGSQDIDGFFFETEHELLPYPIGSYVTMRWCAMNGSWWIKGVRPA